MWSVTSYTFGMQDPFEPLPPRLAKRITERVTETGIGFSPIKTVAALVMSLVIVYVVLN